MPPLWASDVAGVKSRQSIHYCYCSAGYGGKWWSARAFQGGRRFPPPWSVEEQDECFTVRDQNGQKLAHIYFEDEPGRRSARKPLTRDEVRRIADHSEAAGPFCSE